MSVIVELKIPAAEFAFGESLAMERGTRIELEALVPLGTSAIPFFWAYDSEFPDLRASIESHEAVESIRVVDNFDDRVLFALEYEVADDPLFSGILDADGVILDARGTSQSWQFDLRFPEHALLSQFKSDMDDANVPIDVLRVYNPTRPDAGPNFGLTERQYETLVLAVDAGYYDIPRRCTTVELANRLGISDQAVTERLRRAIVSLSENTLFASDDVLESQSLD